MDESEKKETLRRYDERLDRFGANEQALGWGEKGRSSLRFEILASQWDLEGRSVLDFGCGFGDFFGYITRKYGKKIEYLGIDLNPRLIEIAKQRYPEARFEVLDLQSTHRRIDVDYSFASGVFNFKLKDNSSFVNGALARLFESSSRGVGVNFLSDRVDYTLQGTFHADPTEMLRVAYSFTNNVVLRNDYMPYEFSVFLNKGSRIDPKFTVYEEYLKYL